MQWQEFLEKEFAKDDIATDDDLVERYREAASFCHANGIIRNKVPVDDWFDHESILHALADLGLQNYWTAWKADGTPSA